jgi:hypothetical protein
VPVGAKASCLLVGKTGSERLWVKKTRTTLNGNPVRSGRFPDGGFKGNIRFKQLIPGWASRIDGSYG